jgi:DNA-damage-inducible protein J
MASTAMLNIGVDEDIKRDIERLYESLGINMNTAVNMFFKQCLIEEAIPFQIKHKHRHLTTAERLRDYTGDYKVTEWDTGELVGREVF